MERGAATQSDEFSKVYEVAWDELDPIGHLRGPVLIDYALNTQMSWLAHYGYTQVRFAEAGYDPIILRLDVRFHREVILGDSVRDTPQFAGLSPDGTMWKINHQIMKTDGEKVATIRIEGTWFNWKKRQVVAPDADLLQILKNVQHTPDFKEMRPLFRPKEV